MHDTYLTQGRREKWDQRPIAERAASFIGGEIVIRESPGLAQDVGWSATVMIPLAAAV